MKTQIIVRKEYRGTRWYYPQYRGLFGWKFFEEQGYWCVDKVAMATFEEAQEYLDKYA